MPYHQAEKEKYTKYIHEWSCHHYLLPHYTQIKTNKSVVAKVVQTLNIDGGIYQSKQFI